MAKGLFKEKLIRTWYIYSRYKRRPVFNILFTYVIQYPDFNLDPKASSDTLEPAPSVFFNTKFIHTSFMKPIMQMERRVNIDVCCLGGRIHQDRE